MTATTPGTASTTDARKRLAEQNGNHVRHWDPAVAQLIEQARAEGAAEVVARIASAAVVAHKGPNDTDADFMRVTARDLRGGYDIGGSNRRAAVACVLDVVADTLDGTR